MAFQIIDDVIDVTDKEVNRYSDIGIQPILDEIGFLNELPELVIGEILFINTDPCIAIRSGGLADGADAADGINGLDLQGICGCGGKG